MTRNDFYTHVANGNLTEEVRSYAQTQVNKYLEETSAKEAENAKYIEALLAYLKTQSEPVRAAEIAEALDCTTSKATSLCKKLVENSVLTRESAVYNKRSIYVYKLA